MAGMLDTLEIAKKALLAQQAGLQVAGSNIANVNTPGFSRRQIILEPSTTLSSYPDRGTGVEVGEIRRIYNRFLDAQIVREKSILSKLEEESSMFRQIEAFFNELENSGLGKPLQEFFASLQDLANNPSWRPGRIAFLQKAGELSSSFRRLSANLRQLQQDVNDSIAKSIEEIDDTLDQIAELNKNIAKMEASGEEAAELRDRREQLLEKLSEWFNIEFFEREDGQLTVLLAGRSLVDGATVWQLKLGRDPSDPHFYYVQMEDDIDVTSSISQGRLKGLLELRDTILQDYINRLDKLAYILVDEFNAQHQVGFGLDGSTGNNFFIPLSTEAGAASKIALDPSIMNNPDKIATARAQNLAGDNRNALALADLQNRSLIEGTNLQGYLNSLVTDLGIKASDVYGRLEQQEAIVAQLSNQRESVSGVSLEEEMLNLIKFGSAFRGAARIISLLDEMLDTLINMV